MTRKHLALVVFAALAGCVPDQPIKIYQFAPYTTCPTSTTAGTIGVFLEGGSLDVSGSLSYLTEVELQSDLVQPTPPSSPEGNDFLLNQAVFQYAAALTPAGATASQNLPIKQDVIALANDTIVAQTNVGTGALQGSPGFISMDLIGVNAATALNNNVHPGDQVLLQVKLQVNGNLRSGQAMSTNQAVFPITVFNSGALPFDANANQIVCPAGISRIPSGPCLTPGGQDGSTVGCCITPDGGMKPTGC